MPEISYIIDRIDQKFKQLVEEKSRLEAEKKELLSKIEEISSDILRLENNHQVAEDKILILEKTKSESEEAFRQQIRQLEEQIKELKDMDISKKGEAVDVSEIVKEIDDCIHLIKNEL